MNGKNTDFGSFIKHSRRELKLTQAEVANELFIDPSTLSKIENGLQVPTHLQYKALMELYGHSSDDINFVFMTNEERFGYLQLEELRFAMRDNQIEKVKKIIKEVEMKTPFDDGIYLQFLMYAKAISGIYNSELISKLLEAVKLTKPNFNILNFNKSKLSYNEITIIAEIAYCFHENGDLERALIILKEIKNCIDSYTLDEREKSKLYPIILINMAYYLLEANEYDEVLSLCFKAKQLALKYNNLKTLPYILHYQACAIFEKGNIEEYKKDTLQAYFVAKALDNFGLIEMIKTDAEEKLGVDLTIIRI